MSIYQYRFKQTKEIDDTMKFEAANYLKDHLKDNINEAQAIIDKILDVLFIDTSDTENSIQIYDGDSVELWNGKTRLALYLLSHSAEECEDVFTFLEDACWDHDNCDNNDQAKVIEWLDDYDSPFVFKYYYPRNGNMQDLVKEKLQTYFNHSPQYLS